MVDNENAINSNNPISEPQELRACLGKPRLTPRAGVIQVFINGRGELFTAEEDWPLNIGEWMAGRIWTRYEVDVGEHLLEFECELPCQQDIGHFHAQVRLAWKVSEPVEVVRRHLVDVRGELEPWICDRMRRMARETDVRHRAEAEATINHDLGAKTITVDDLGLEICRFKVTLTLDEAARKHVDRITAIGREKEADEHEEALRQARIEVYRKAMAGGHHEFILLRLAQQPEDLPAILQMLREEDADVRNRLLAAFKAMLDADVLEEFEFDKTRVDILKRVVDDVQASFQSRSLTGELPKSLLEPRQPSTDLDDRKAEDGEKL